MTESGRQSFDPADPRSSVALLDDERQRKAWREKKRQELLAETGDVVKAAQQEPEWSTTDLVKYVVLLLGAITLLVVAVAYGLIYYLDHYSNA